MKWTSYDLELCIQIMATINVFRIARKKKNPLLIKKKKIKRFPAVSNRTTLVFKSIRFLVSVVAVAVVADAVAVEDVLRFLFPFFVLLLLLLLSFLLLLFFFFARLTASQSLLICLTNSHQIKRHALIYLFMQYSDSRTIQHKYSHLLRLILETEFSLSTSFHSINSPNSSPLSCVVYKIWSVLK